MEWLGLLLAPLALFRSALSLFRWAVERRNSGQHEKPRIHIEAVKKRHSRPPNEPIFAAPTPKDRYLAIIGTIEVTVTSQAPVIHLEDLRFEVRRRRCRFLWQYTIVEVHGDHVPEVWRVERFKRDSFFFSVHEPDVHVRVGETLFLNAIARDHRSLLRSNAIAVPVQDPS